MGEWIINTSTDTTMDFFGHWQTNIPGWSAYVSQDHNRDAILLEMCGPVGKRVHKYFDRLELDRFRYGGAQLIRDYIVELGRKLPWPPTMWECDYCGHLNDNIKDYTCNECMEVDENFAYRT